MDSENPDACGFKLEVICEYKNTPDLQYAVCEYIKPLSVTISPEQVDPNGQVELTVKVEPPQQAALEIIDWGPLMVEEAQLKTQKNGEFARKFTVKADAKSGKYDIRVRAPSLNREGSASLVVIGEQSDPYQSLNCRFEYSAILHGKHYHTGGRVEDALGSRGDTFHFKGSFKGNTFEGNLAKIGDGAKTDPFYTNPIGTITVTVAPTDNPTEFTITGYTLKVKYGTPPKTNETFMVGETTMDATFNPSGTGTLWVAIDGAASCKYINKYRYIHTISTTERVIYESVTCNDNLINRLWIKFQ